MSNYHSKIKTTPITVNESRERESFKMFKFLFPLPKTDENGNLNFNHLSEIERKYKALTFNAKLVYILLKNKYLCITDNGKNTTNNAGVYADENGDIYVEYTTKDFIEITGIKDPKTIRNAKAQLKESYLLEEVKTTGKNANRFYLLRPQIINRSLKYNINDTDGLETYYELPKYLFEHTFFKNMPLSAKFAYAILRERYLYSVKNNNENFVDNNGNIYCIFTTPKLASAIGYNSKTSVVKVKQILKDKQLLVEEQITGESSKIYINTPKNLYDIEKEKGFKPTESKPESKGEKLDALGGKSWTPRGEKLDALGGKSWTPRGEKLDSIDTPYKHTFINTLLINYYNLKNSTQKNKKSSGSYSKNNKVKNNLISKIKDEYQIQKLTKTYERKIQKFSNTFNLDIMTYAIEYAGEKGTTSPTNLLMTILTNWEQAGVQTLEQAKAQESKYKSVKGNIKHNRSIEKTPQWLLDRDKKQEQKEVVTEEERKKFEEDKKKLQEQMASFWND